MRRPGKELQPSPPSLLEATGLSLLTSIPLLVTWTQRNVGHPDRSRLSAATWRKEQPAQSPWSAQLAEGTGAGWSREWVRGGSCVLLGHMPPPAPYGILSSPPLPGLTPPSLHPCRYRIGFLLVSVAQADRVRTPGFLLFHSLLCFILFLYSFKLLSCYSSYSVFSSQAMSPVSMASIAIFILRTSKTFDQDFFWILVCLLEISTWMYHI